MVGIWETTKSGVGLPACEKISSFVLCLKRSWGSIFLTGNILLCTDGVLSQRFGDFLDLCEKVFLVKFFSLISLLMYMWSLS